MRHQYASRLVRFVVTELARRADPDKAAATAAYMKTEMPFYGVQKPGRVEILREVTTRMPPEDLDEYRDGVASLWSLSHREEKYLAIAYARSFPAYVALRQLDLYRQMIVEGAWWDFVDDVAANLVGRIHRAEPERMRPILWEWIDAADMWLRRAALLSQLRSKSDTAAIFRVGRCGPRRRRAAARRQRRRHRRTHLCRR